MTATRSPSLAATANAKRSAVYVFPAPAGPSSARRRRFFVRSTFLNMEAALRSVGKAAPVTGHARAGAGVAPRPSRGTDGDHHCEHERGDRDRNHPPTAGAADVPFTNSSPLPPLTPCADQDVVLTAEQALTTHPRSPLRSSSLAHVGESTHR